MAAVKFAVVDVSDFLTKKQAAEPDIAADWAKLEELYNKKLWHQLTLKLQDFVKHPSLQTADNLIQLYSNFLTTFENKINPLSLIEIIAHVVKQYSNKKDAIAFLEKMETKVKMNDEAFALCKVLQGQIYLEHLNDLDSTEKIIEHLEGTLEDADGVTPVHGRFYKLASEYYRVRGPMARYYRAALRYLGCSDGGATLPQQERKALALRLALAAVIAPTVYDLGELLAHPILESLEGTPDAWAIELVRTAAKGDVQGFEAVRQRAKHPDLNRAERQLRQKIAILCLMEKNKILGPLAICTLCADLIKSGGLKRPHCNIDRDSFVNSLRELYGIDSSMKMAFNRTSAQRKLTFAEVAASSRVPRDEVELLLMKALAENLVKGHIDQVNETMTVTWVRPRALGRAGASALAARLATWAAAVSAAADLLSKAPDLCTL